MESARALSGNFPRPSHKLQTQYLKQMLLKKKCTFSISFLVSIKDTKTDIENVHFFPTVFAKTIVTDLTPQYYFKDKLAFP